MLRNILYVFLDRDGVINRKPPEGEFVAQWSQFHPLPGVESAIAALNRSNRRVIVISNQRGVALGYYSIADVKNLQNRIQQYLAQHSAHIDAFYFCPHDEGQCNCRKPEIGLFEQAFQAFPGASALNSVMIGDSLADIKAARTLGMPSIFIQGDPRTQKPGADEAANLANTVAASFAEAVTQCLL